MVSSSRPGAVARPAFARCDLHGCCRTVAGSSTRADTVPRPPIEDPHRIAGAFTRQEVDCVHSPSTRFRRGATLGGAKARAVWGDRRACHHGCFGRFLALDGCGSGPPCLLGLHAGQSRQYSRSVYSVVPTITPIAQILPGSANATVFVGTGTTTGGTVLGNRSKWGKGAVEKKYGRADHDRRKHLPDDVDRSVGGSF